MLVGWSELVDQWMAVFNSNLADMGPMGIQILKIIWINILLSGDNAVVIALACRGLPRRQRIWGIILGAGAAVILRIIFTVGLQFVLKWDWLRLVGGILLLYISVKLLAQEEAHEESVESAENVWDAVKTVAIADIVMSLDNVLAIAAAAKGHPWLIAFGLAVSIPLIVAGATLIMDLLSRYPILVWAGAGLLGWIAGELIASDKITLLQTQNWNPSLVVPDLDPESNGLKAAPLLHYGAATISTAFVLSVGWLLMKWHGRAGRQTAENKSAAE